MTTIACLGDSITFGDGDTQLLGWVGRLNAYLQSREPHVDWVYNLGIPGDTVVGACYRYFTEVLPRSPDIVLIAVGTNDCKRIGIDKPDVLRSDLARTMAHWQMWQKSLCSGLHKTVILGTLPSNEAHMPYHNPGKPTTWVLRDDLETYNTALREFCAQAGLPFIDFWPHWQPDMTENYLCDGLHPNNAGYDWMFGIIKDFLEQQKLL